ncbi:MAG: hypothetical protein OXT49_08815, partial [Gammaproteobacteria bacterium]|nr:hypothetical protein [Gammaproteobacteria bacterium]
MALGLLEQRKTEDFSTDRGLQHAFEYALEGEEYSYILKKVDREYVDQSLLQFRPTGEIEAAIEAAVQAARETDDIVSLSRLATLKYRTNDRLEYSLSWELLNETLLHDGKPEHVVRSIYSEQSQEFIVGQNHALRTILALDDFDFSDLASKLFDLYLKEHRAKPADEKADLIAFANCLGRFHNSPKKALTWLSQWTFNADILEPKDFAPEYAPHIENYFNGLAHSRKIRLLKRLSKTGSPFPNKLVKHLAIRAANRYLPKDEVTSLIKEYIASFPEETNLEIAFFAAGASIPADEVNKLAGNFELPLSSSSERSIRSDLLVELRSSLYWAAIFGYVNNTELVHQMRSGLIHADTGWKLAQLHAIHTGVLYGQHLANIEVDWFSEACLALNTITQITDVNGEGTTDVLDALRGALDDTLFILSKIIVERCPAKAADWVSQLIELRQSFAWTTHYGYGSAETNYSFEFTIFRQLTELPPLKPHLDSILKDCARTYEAALSLKGSAQGDHFLNLAAIAAKCSFKTLAKSFMGRGIESSLAYGYRKDTTLDVLTDVLTAASGHKPELILLGASRILELIKWVPYATDGKSTKHFAQYLFPIVLNENRGAALELLRAYYREFATWQSDEALEKYLLSRDDGDPDFLWALCGLLEPNDSVAARKSVSKLFEKDSSCSQGKLDSRAADYIKKAVNPKRWPDELAAERPDPVVAGESGNSQRDSTYILDGQELTIEALKDRCRVSMSGMAKTFEKLDHENDHFPSYELLPTLLEHIEGASNNGDLEAVNQFSDAHVSSYEHQYSQALAEKYLLLGNSEAALEHFENAYQTSPKHELLAPIAKYDEERAKKLVLSTAFEKISGPSYQSFNAPKFIARACEALGQHHEAELIFNQFLNDCEELFANWPAEKTKFNELPNWGNEEHDEPIQVCHLLIDRLEDQDVEYGKRLLSSIDYLANQASEVLLPILFDRLDSSTELAKWRMKIIISRIAHANSSSLHPHSAHIARLIVEV